MIVSCIGDNVVRRLSDYLAPDYVAHFLIIEVYFLSLFFLICVGDNDLVSNLINGFVLIDLFVTLTITLNVITL